MPRRSRSRQPRLKKLSVLELYAVLLWFSQAMSPLVACKYNKTMAEYLSYPPVALAFIVLMIRIHERHQQRAARLLNLNQYVLVLKVSLVYIAAFLLTLLGLVGGLVMKDLARYLTYTGMALVWLVLGIAAYFGLQQGSFKDTVIFLVWFALAHLTATLYPRLVLTPILYTCVLTLCTYNYLLKFDIT